MKRSLFLLEMKKNNGQVLVFVVATMAIALAVGISFSLRTLSSLTRTSTSDTASRVLAAAEGGAERYLSKNISQLDAKVGQPPEVITFLGTENDNISTRASVSVTKYPTSPKSKFIVKKGGVGQINLTNYGSTPIDLCWSSVKSNKDSDLYYSVYSDIKVLEKLGLKSISRNGFPSGYSNNFVDAGNCTNIGHTTSNFKRISGLGSAKYLRIFSINNDSTVELFPNGSGVFPFQGYKITSIGELNNIVSNQKVTKTVTVLRPLPYLPAMFDFGIYSDSGTIYSNF